MQGGPNHSCLPNALRLWAHAGLEPSGEGERARCQTQGPRNLRGTGGGSVSASPNSYGVGANLEGFSSWRFACFLGITNPLGHPFSQSRPWPLGKAQVAVTAATRAQCFPTPWCLPSRPTAKPRGIRHHLAQSRRHIWTWEPRVGLRGLQ